jgi:hypothetical protein
MLILDVLAARRRLGESCWTFTDHPAIVRAIRALAAAGLVGEMGGVTDHSVRAYLTDAGLESVLLAGYRAPGTCDPGVSTDGDTLWLCCGNDPSESPTPICAVEPGDRWSELVAEVTAHRCGPPT